MREQCGRSRSLSGWIARARSKLIVIEDKTPHDINIVNMNEKTYAQLRSHAEQIWNRAIAAVQPEQAVKRALSGKTFSGKVHLIAIGKAAWTMADAAYAELGSRIADGIVITKYGHSKGAIGNLRIFEAGHPVPDDNSYKATEAAMELARKAGDEDTIIFLISGGGSTLFESPLIPKAELADITRQLLASGANIVEMNIIRKRLSAVKGGKFAEMASPARIYSVVLSDILGDPLDMIASGPAYPDRSSCEDAWDVVKKYGLKLSKMAQDCLNEETPKTLSNVETQVTGSVRELCAAAEQECRALGYDTFVLTDRLGCEAREAGRFLADIAETHAGSGQRKAFLAGGETVVKLTGHGLGGRNQELALAAAEGIEGLSAAIFSVGSDGTDGPTDAAGGYVDGGTYDRLRELGINVDAVLSDNDSYHALLAAGGLIKTGPTGTNVNDIAVVLVE